jgi:glycosyltransferase involved in cell wall biosynthesis
MKIALVSEYLPPKNVPISGGVEARPLSLAKQLAKKHEVHIISSLIDDWDVMEQYDGVTVHRIGRRSRYTQRGNFRSRLSFNSSLLLMLSRLNPDIIDASGFVSYAGSYFSAKKIGCPCVATVHEVWKGEWVNHMGLFNGIIGGILEPRFLHLGFDGYISVSNFTSNRLITKMDIDPSKIEVIYNGVDLDLYRSSQEPQKYADPTIVAISRLVDYKKIDVLLRAVHLIKKSRDTIKLKIVGTGPQEEDLKNLTYELGLNGNVEFLGRIVDQNELIRLLKKSHVFALPSVSEGFGMVLLEAMAAGIPYVASDIPPLREITQGGIGGFLCPPNDPQDLAEKITEILSEYATANQKRDDVNRYLDRFDWQRLAIGLEKYYLRICNQRQNRDSVGGNLT